MFLVEPDIKRHWHDFLFIIHHYKILRREERQRSEKQADVANASTSVFASPL